MKTIKKSTSSHELRVSSAERIRLMVRGSVFRRLRVEKGLTQGVMCKKLRVAGALLSCFEVGTYRPSMRSVSRFICNVMGIDDALVDELMLQLWKTAYQLGVFKGEAEDGWSELEKTIGVESIYGLVIYVVCKPEVRLPRQIDTIDWESYFEIHPNKEELEGLG